VTAPKTTLWKVDDHTRAKHAILRNYLNAWLPIMASFNERLILIDGFAGPGEYEGGAIGSPQIMIDAFLNHKDPRIRQKRVEFLFIEEDEARYQHLRQLLARKQQQQPFPKTMTYRHFQGTFHTIIDNFLWKEGKNFRSDPIFAFIDPFGYSHTPMEIIECIMSRSLCEVLITSMYEEVNRFLTVDCNTKARHYNEFFGTDEWRNILIDRPGASEREARLRDLYRNQLKVAGAKYVRPFRMRNKHNATDYFLFFATKHLKGMEAMKRAMLAVDKTGEYSFSDFANPDQLLIFSKPNYMLLQKLLGERFGGSVVSVKEIEEFVIGDTDFLNFKREALLPMEQAVPPKLEVVLLDRGYKRKRGDYPGEKVHIRFF
jgi:three-Cys-motif partner protein